ncbi:hypothetical protein F4804DRAFT_344695 [Jackrogersella minutella]|nr:hypothetical protein F4804DRAFT_344695 [Jackrogersella minutella]
MAFQVFTQESWRRTGSINVLLAFTCGIALSSCLIVSLKKPGASLNTATIIFEDQCSSTSNLNTALHLLLNLLSTAILASSNYFMQIVASPSREEIDKAHKFLYPLDVGVLSTKNILFISYFKRTCWVVLLLSSFPIHLFFNSSVFETSFQGSNWHLTIATEAFTHSADFFPPGASLTQAGSPTPPHKYDMSIGQYYIPNDTSVGDDYGGYGKFVPLALYADKASDIRKNITKTAADCSNWINLDANDCRAEYTACKPRTKYRDVVIIVESHAGSIEGWSREEVFNLTQNASLFWDAYVPQHRINSLWYSTECTTTMDANTHQEECSNDCGVLLNIMVSNYDPEYIGRDNTNSLIPRDWTFSFDKSGSSLQIATASGYNDRSNDMAVKYCLAEPLLVHCKIGLSNLLLMVVVICIFIKVVMCGIIIWKLPHTSLVTLGDAMESFVTKPDSHTIGLGTLDIVDSVRLETQPRRYWSTQDGSLLTSGIKPRQWHATNRRYLYTVPQAVWMRTYILILFSLSILVGCLVLSYQSNGNSFQASFGRSEDNRSTNIGDGGYLYALLIANVPQLLLSLCYFSYNGFFTRLLNEQEWNSYGISLRPLRVSLPIGKQVSSYRLQLPYKYSVPLLSISVLCHWLLSSALFLFIIEGGIDNLPDIDDDHLISMTDDFEEHEQKLRELSQSELKWGVLPLPDHLAEVNDESGRTVMHLGFGDESANIRSPEGGGWYV